VPPVAAAGDVVVPVNGRDLCCEVKCRANGFRELYGWLAKNDVLIVAKRDSVEALAHQGTGTKR
jgi:hypothetical protein